MCWFFGFILTVRIIYLMRTWRFFSRKVLFMKLFSFFDSVAKEYMAPFESPNAAQAVRTALASMRRKGPDGSPSGFCQHRNDYVLVQLAEFDISTGLFSDSSPEVIAPLAQIWATAEASE